MDHSLDDYEYEDYYDEEDDQDGAVDYVTLHPNSVLPFQPVSHVEGGEGKSGGSMASLDHKSLLKTKKKVLTKPQHHPDGDEDNSEGNNGIKKQDASGDTASTTSSSSSPHFLQEPEDSYIIKGKNARLHCQVASADKAYFVCNGEAMAESKLHREKDFVSSSGEAVKDLGLDVTRNQVEEFFGQFACRCDAWSSAGRVASRNATVQTACKWKTNRFWAYFRAEPS